MRPWVTAGAVAFGLASLSGPLCADSLKYEILFGGSRPAARAPWLTATFGDVGREVRLTLSTAGLVGSEFIGRKGRYFNFNFNDDKIDPLGDLQFTHVSGTGAPRLGAGMETVDDITGVEDLTASDSLGYLGTPSGGQWWSAARVEDLQGGGSGQVAAIPEPATVMLAGLGALGAVFWAGRRRRR